MVTLTEPAAVKVKQLLEKEGKPNAGLRLRVVGGGCSGLSYEMGFDDQPQAGDTTYEFHGVRLFVDSQAEMYLNGASVDYTEGLMGSGFKIQNPNEKGSCGCGHSFSV